MAQRCAANSISLSHGDARALAALLRRGLAHLQPSRAVVRSPGSASAASLEHAKTLGLRPLPLDPEAPADLLLVVESKAFLQAQRGSAVEGKRWAAQ